MAHFIQLHLLTSYAASNLNRDDTGRPKTLMYGGAERLRISSQSLKRAFRTSEVFTSYLPEALGKRSIGLADKLVTALKNKGLSEQDATKRAGLLIEHNKMGKLKKDEAKTEQLVHLSLEEMAALNAMADYLANNETIEGKEGLVLQNKPKAADIAMFGRMLADNPAYNVEAAVQVAHAFTTHRATVEDDFYTAVDDLKNADLQADRGAGFIGVTEYGAGLFYLYICINASHLLENLAGDIELAKKTLAALITSAATISPGGKQNAFASRARASYILQEIGSATPRSLAAAFEKPVKGENYLDDSISQLTGLRTNFIKAYGDQTEEFILHVSNPATKSLQDLITAAHDTVDKAA